MVKKWRFQRRIVVEHGFCEWWLAQIGDETAGGVQDRRDKALFGVTRNCVTDLEKTLRQSDITTRRIFRWIGQLIEASKSLFIANKHPKSYGTLSIQGKNSFDSDVPAEDST